MLHIVPSTVQACFFINISTTTSFFMQRPSLLVTMYDFSEITTFLALSSLLVSSPRLLLLLYVYYSETGLSVLCLTSTLLTLAILGL